MESKTNSQQRARKRIFRSWFALATLCGMVLFLAASHVVNAEPRTQTVPPTPPEATATPVPQATATPKPDKNDDNNDDESAPPVEPTESPVGETDTTNRAPATSSDATTGVVTADRLNVRAGPGVDFAVIGKLLAGEEVSILGRNIDSSWLQVCCIAGATTEGWVSATYVTLAAGVQPPVVGSSSTPTATIASALPVSTTAAIDDTSTSTTTLELTIAQTPPFVWQGQEATLELTVVNRGDSPAFGVSIRDELPPTLIYVDASAGAAGNVTQTQTNAGGMIFTIAWPEVAAGATVSANVSVRISSEAADGTVLDNLAVVSAENAAPYTNGISIGMPPTSLPTFQ